MLQVTDAMSGAFRAAIETGNDWLRSETLAAIGTLSSEFPELTFLARTGDDEAAQVERRSEIQSAEMLVDRDAVGDGGPWTAGCPYLGLLPFDQAHAAVFRGRQRLTTELTAKLAGRLGGPAMIVVSGASGAGKSSLLHAGLLPALMDGTQLPGSARWPRVVMTPGTDPLAELATQLAALSGGDAAALQAALAADPDRAQLAVGQAIRAGAVRRAGPQPLVDGVPERLVIVVDQFEEVFTLASSRDGARQQAFMVALIAAATHPFSPHGQPPAVVVIAVRGDFWARCAADPGLARIMQDGLFVVGPMTEPELRQAITGPAAAVGLQIDANLADIILADLRTANRDEAGGTLPLLSQAMMLTWGKREGNRLTVRGYNETGGVGRAVEFGAEAVYAALPDAGQHIAREIFEALVLTGPDGQLARRPAFRANLCPSRHGAARLAVDNVLEVFAGSRLLVLDGDTVQIAHDVLLRAWPRLRAWLDREQANWILYAQLRDDAARWAEHGRDSSFFYRGSELAAVRQAAARWAADTTRYPALSQDESAFLAASSRHAARGARVRRAAVLTLALLLIVSVAGVAVAARADMTANHQRNMALSNQLAAQSEALDATNPQAAAALAAAAWKIDPTLEAQTAQLDVLAQPGRGSITAASGNIAAMAFSPDGKRFATMTDAGIGQIWDTATYREIGKPVSTNSGGTASIWFGPGDTAITFAGGMNGPGQFWSISARRLIGPQVQIANDPIAYGIFSPDGTIVATNAENDALSFVDVATHREIGATIPSGEPIAFSPDGKLLAVGVPYGEGADGAVQLMDVATHDLVGPVIPSRSDYDPAAAFSPDGRVLAATGSGSVRFMDVADGRTSGKPLAVTATALAYSPNGKILATISQSPGTNSSATVNLWDAASHEELGGPVTVDATAGGLVFSPDSAMLATADGSTVTFWDVAISRQIGTVIGGAQAPVAFGRDGQMLAAATGRAVGLWSVATHREIGAPLVTEIATSAADMAFSPDGKILAASGGDPQLYNVDPLSYLGGPAPNAFQGADALAFSLDGDQLVYAQNGSTWRWDMRTHRVVGHAVISGVGHPSAETFAPGGSVLATFGNEVRLFSVASRRAIGAPFATGVGTIAEAVFSPDGRTLATASNSGVVLWDVATQRQIGTALNVDVGPVNAVAFSPDGMILAVADQDGTIRLWDVASHEQIGSPLVVNQDPVDGVTFSPDGTVLAASSGGTRLWGMPPTRDLVDHVCAIAGGSMSRAQWNSYVKSEPFQPTCP